MNLPPDVDRAVAASFFGALPEATREALFGQARVVAAPARTVLHTETTEPANPHLYVVVGGLVRVFRMARSGREVTLRLAQPGDVIGLPSVVANASPASAQAVVDSRVLYLSARDLRTEAKRNAGLAWAMAEEIAGSLFNIQERMAHNVFAPISSRVARYLLEVAMPTGDRLVAATSHEEIANAIGTVREVVARVVAGMRSDGLTERGPEGIVLLDVPRLRAAAQSEEFGDFRDRASRTWG